MQATAVPAMKWRESAPVSNNVIPPENVFRGESALRRFLDPSTGRDTPLVELPAQLTRLRLKAFLFAPK